MPQAFRWSSPTELLVKPDHYLVRLMRSQGVSEAQLGIRPRGGSGKASGDGSMEEVADDREAWRTFCAHSRVLRGTPTALWLRESLAQVFGWRDWPLGVHNADASFDALSAKLASAEFAPAALLQRFGVEFLSTTDAASSDLRAHTAIAARGLPFRVVPTFRPDAALQIGASRWRAEVTALGVAAGVRVKDYASYLRALRARRAAFKRAGALAADHGVDDLRRTPPRALPLHAAEDIFAAALAGDAPPSSAQAAAFEGHMLMQMARMSTEDGMVMQMHCGVHRGHDERVARLYGPDMGGDVPLPQEFVHSLHELLNAYGTHPNMTIILFTLDEAAYSRDLAPLAGTYPALRLGPPWWFHDSRNGMRRYLEAVTESAGIDNLAGFNDDTRALPSIAARHDLWRRAVAAWAAEMADDGVFSEQEAREVVWELAYGRARAAYRIPAEPEAGGGGGGGGVAIGAGAGEAEGDASASAASAAPEKAEL